MIARMIAGVRDQDIDDDAPPELMHVLRWARTITP